LRKPEPGFSPAALAAVLFGELRLPLPARLVLALSGGLDSMALLHALAALRADFPLSLRAVHIDHGLQPDSAAWGRQCARACERLAVAFEGRPVTVTAVAADGLEAAARRARYAALAELLARGEILATAHQRDDQAETVLLQLLRGTGVAGLAGMPARAAFGRGELVRPLLGFARAALEAYGHAQGLAWIEDPSNLDTRLRRNYLRSEIMPRLRAVWPEADTMLVRAAGHATEAAVLLEELAATDLAGCRATDAANHVREALSVAKLTGLSPARQRNAVRSWLRQQGLLAPGAHQLEALLAQLRHRPRSRHACVRWPGAEVWRYRDQLVVLPPLTPPDATLDVTWDGQQPLQLPGIGRLSTEAVLGAGIACRHLAAGLRVGLRHGGERLRLPGRTQHHALKKLLQAAAVPPWLRGRMPVFYVAGALAAVADLWVCDGFTAGSGEPGARIVWEPYAEAAGEPEIIR
jgi:tRNA(Ile)-lysidine synthase